MSLRLWRKNKIFSYYTKRGALFRKVINPWHTISLTNKARRSFGKSKKIYSTELRSVLFIRLLFTKSFPAESTVGYAVSTAFYKITSYDIVNKTTLPVVETNLATFWYNQWRSFIKEHKNLYWRSLFTSSFWIFKNPMAVPGAVIIRRSKSLNTTLLRAFRNYNLWNHRIGFGALQSTYMSILKSNHKGSHVGSHIHYFMSVLESLWPSILTKTGMFSTVGESRSFIKHSLLYNNVVDNGRLRTTHAQIERLRNTKNSAFVTCVAHRNIQLNSGGTAVASAKKTKLSYGIPGDSFSCYNPRVNTNLFYSSNQTKSFKPFHHKMCRRLL